MESKSVVGNINGEAHGEDVVISGKKNRHKNEGISVWWAGEKTVKFAEKENKKDEQSRICALLMCFTLNTESVREKLQQSDNIFRLMLDLQK